MARETTVGNPDRAVQDRRRSGAAGKHGDRRTKRQRTRATVRAAAIRHG
jgi:hypothetical protein